MAQLRAFTETLEDAVRERTRELEAQNEARRKAEEPLRQAQKMEAVGQLTGGIAHDFNNLLTIIIGGLDLIGRAARRARRHRRRRAHRAARATWPCRARSAPPSLTNRLLAFSRQQPLDPQPLDANRLVAGMSDLLRRTLGEAIALETVLAGGLWRAFADPNQLENAMLNLAVNARDAMPEGGKLTIETANCYLDEAYVDAPGRAGRAPGQYVMIAVTDTGTGMDAATRRARVRAVLHHQGRRQGHRPGPEPGLWLRPAVRRPREHLQRDRPRHDGEALPAAPSRRRRARATAAERRPPAAARHRRRDHPGRRGRRSAAQLHDRERWASSATACWTPPTAPPRSRSSSANPDRPAVHRRGHAGAA